MAMPTSGTLIAVNNGVSKYATNVPGFFETTGWEVQSTYLDSFGHLWVMAANHPDEDSGDLTLGRCDYSGGAWHKVGEGMQMKGFGHGLSFGIEIAGTDFYVWSECDTSGAGRGKAIAKYLYQDDVVIFNDDVTPMYPFGEGMVTDCSCTVQFGSVPVFVMRCAYFGFHFYQAWNLADAINNTWTSPYLSQGFGNLGQIEPTLVDSGGDALIMQG